MPKARFTLTGQDVIDRVKRTFGDESGVQIVQADVLRWVNDAQRTINESNQVLLAKATRDITGGTAVYDFDDLPVHHIQSLIFDSTPLRPLSFQDAQSYILGKDTPGGDPSWTVPEIWWEYDGEINLWPKPLNSITGGLVLYYVGDPVELTDPAQSLSVPDTYFNALFALVMQQAYALDENWQGMSAVKDMASESLTRLQGQERKQEINLYPFAQVDPDDLW